MGAAFSMSALTSLIAASWSGVSVNGNASSSSRCHGVSGANAWPGAEAPGRIQLDQLRSDVAHRLPGTTLGLGPVGAAELVDRRDLTADVAGQQVQCIGRDEQPVPGMAPLARRVFDDEVFADRAAGRAADQVDVLPDAVLGVDHVVAGLQREGVDRVASAGRHLGRRAHRRRSPGSREVRLGDHGQAGSGDDEAVLQPSAGHRDEAGARRMFHGVAGQRHREVGLGQTLGGARRGTGAGDHHDGDTTVSSPLLRVGDRRGDLTAVGRRGHDGGRSQIDAAVLPGEVWVVDAERSDPPQR